MFEKPLAIACVILLVYSVVTTISLRSEIKNYAEFKAKVELAQQQAEDDFAKQEKDFNDIIRKTSDDWATVLKHSRSNPTVRVLPGPSCDLREGATISATGLKPHEETSESRLGNEFIISIEEIETRLNNAAEDAAQVILLQEFIQSTHEASK